MANCSDLTYFVRKTSQSSEESITIVNKEDHITDQFDIDLFGKRRKEYGEDFNQNLLNILENFSCPASSENEDEPDLTQTTENKLEHPIDGQFWHNSTNHRIYQYFDEAWHPLASTEDVAGNYGHISHGEQIPLPQSAVTGQEFTYQECSWIVAPLVYNGEIDFMRCSTTNDGEVIMQYRLVGEAEIQEGTVSYQIIGIKESENNKGISNPIPDLP